MAQRPRLADLKRICPHELSHCEGYIWHLGSRIGKGSFGEVYLGWNTAGTIEVAVKVVRREFFKQDPKVRENLDREIRILKLLRGCEYVVQLYHVQEMKHYIVLVMELCEYDLDHLVKVELFKEDEIVIFLHQLAKGMKALREQNIVHRDLKPGNILIRHHPHTKKMLIKLADFGFARHFKDEGMKPIDMTSLAGTPVFMAPEALSCVFHPGKHYDDKVDIWSIGALLYKVIVGQCGFYAQLQDIPRILKHKGDAIAFERVPHSRKINYVTELPPSVSARFSEPFRARMNELLKEMLKLDPTERMTFPQFFDTVDDIITSKIEIVNLLHGTSHKIINDPQLTVEDIVSAASTEYHLPSKFVVLFSTKSRFYITGQNTLTPQQFTDLLNDAGGAEGHALLYLLPITQLSPDKNISDYSCIAPLKNELNDMNKFVSLVFEHKFSDEMVGMIKLMQSQQKRQLEGLEEFSLFCSREIAQFTANVCRQFSEQGYQAMAKAGLAAQWLQEDINSLSSNAQRSQLQVLLNTIAQHRDQIGRLVAEGGSFGSTPAPSVTISLKADDLDKKSSALAEDTKRLSQLTRDQIVKVGNRIKEDCQKQIDEVTGKVRDQLRPLYDHLQSVWGMGQKLTILQRNCAQLDHLLTQIAQERTLVLKSLSSSNVVTDARQQRGTPTGAGTPGPAVLVSPPMGWPQPPPPANSYYNNSQLPPAPAEMDSLRREKEDLASKLTYKHQEVEKLNVELSTLKGQLASRHRNSGSGGDEMEKTIVAGTSNGRLSPSAALEGMSLAPPDHKLLQELTEKLNQFCRTADKLPGVSVATAEQPQHQQVKEATTPVSSPGPTGTLYPDLMDYTIISIQDRALAPPTSGQGASSIATSQDIQALLPQAKKLSELLQSNVSTLETLVMKSAKGTLTISSDHALIKIGRPTEYEKDDIVLFHPVRLQSTSTAPAVLHLQKPRPYIFMDDSSHGSFNIRPGRMPELFLGELSEKPRKLKFEDHPDIAKEVQESTGFFYRVKAKPTTLKFSVAPTSTAPARPPPPTNTPPQSSKSRTTSASEGRSGGKFTNLFHHHKNSGKKGGFV